jgi:hypothetical protein
MNARQRLALTHPCLLACETAHPRYGRSHGSWTSVLTVNTGYE